MKIEYLMAKIKAYIDDPSSQTGYGMATIQQLLKIKQLIITNSQKQKTESLRDP